MNELATKELIALRDEVKAYFNHSESLLEKESESFSAFINDKSVKWESLSAWSKLTNFLKDMLLTIRKNPQKIQFQNDFAAFVFKAEVIAEFNDYLKSSAHDILDDIKIRAIASNLFRAKSIKDGYQVAVKFLDEGDVFLKRISQKYGDYQAIVGAPRPSPLTLAQRYLTALWILLKQALIAEPSLLKSLDSLGETLNVEKLIKWIEKENKKLHENDVPRKKLLAEFKFKLEVLRVLALFESRGSPEVIRKIGAEILGVKIGQESIVVLERSAVSSDVMNINKRILAGVEVRKKQYAERLEVLSKRSYRLVETEQVDVQKKIVKIVEVAPKAVEPKSPQQTLQESPAVFFSAKHKEEKVAASPVRDLQKELKSNQQEMQRLTDEYVGLKKTIAEAKRYYLASMESQLKNKWTHLSQIGVNLNKLDKFTEEYKRANESSESKAISAKIAKRGWDYIPLGNWFAKKFGATDVEDRRQAVENYFKSETVFEVVSNNLHKPTEQSEFCVGHNVSFGCFEGIHPENFKVMFRYINTIRTNEDRLEALKEDNNALAVLSSASKKPKASSEPLYKPYPTGRSPLKSSLTQ